jgi:hypothetical protein
VLEEKCIHESEKSLILGAKDHGAVESYRKVLLILKKTENDEDIDDLASHTDGSITHSSRFNAEDDISAFINFTSKVGLDEETARLEFDKLINHNSGDNNEFSKTTRLEDFRQFCDNRGVHMNGTRTVVLKFIKDRTQYLREKEIRTRMGTSQFDRCVCPLLDDYDVDRLLSSNRTENGENRFHLGLLKSDEGSWDLPHEIKDALFADDIKDKASNHCLAAFRYALVLPKGDRDLAAIMCHEKSGILEVREYLSTIGRSLHKLHDEGNSRWTPFQLKPQIFLSIRLLFRHYSWVLEFIKYRQNSSDSRIHRS